MAKILIVNYKIPAFPKDFQEVPKEQLDRIISAAAEDAKLISTVPGLRWKIYLQNQGAAEVGGVYFFEDEASLRAYLDGPIMAKRKAGKTFLDLAIQDLSIKQFDVIEGLTRITRGPI